MKIFILISAILLFCVIVYAQNANSEIDECIKKCSNSTSSNKRHLVKRDGLPDLLEFLQKLLEDLWHVIISVPEKGFIVLDKFFKNFSKFHEDNILRIYEILKVDDDDDDDEE